jgi:hypothetical protein
MVNKVCYFLLQSQHPSAKGGGDGDGVEVAAATAGVHDRKHSPTP